MDRTDFGPYRLLNLLGRGGMGEVYQAHDTSTDRVVAIKLLPAHLAGDEDFRQRFLREARIAASLNEPHVVPIHRFGELDGRLYVDMRFIEGRDLSKILAEGPLAPARAVTVVEQIAAALDTAHRAGLVHRDVKPSNILLTHRDFAYLIDFGIARALDETSITHTGHTLGSIAYMSPERLAGHHSDGRADVYALTCVLYECLTGHRPFPGRGAGEQVTAHMMAPPPRPSALGFPAALDGVIATGMAKDPAARFPSADQLAHAARATLSGTPAGTAPPVNTQPWQRPATVADTLNFSRRAPWWKRHPVALTAVVATIVAAIAIASLIVAFPPTTSAAGPVDLDALLLGTREVEAILDEQNMVVISKTDSVPEDARDPVDPRSCSSIVYVGDEDEFADAVRMRGQGIYAPSNNYLPNVEERVVQFPSEEAARTVFDATATSWQACLNQDISVDTSTGTPETDRFDDFDNEGGVLSVRRSVVEAIDGFGCQHVMAVKSSLVVTVRACSFALADQGREVTSKIVERIPA